MIRTHLGIRAVVIAVHFGWAAAVYHKPNAPLLYQSYSAFTDFAPWHAFGWSALAIALLMLLSRPGTMAAQWASFLSSIFFFTVVAAIGRGVGFTTGVSTYSILAFASLAMFALDFRAWFSQRDWVKRLIANPPQRWRK
ncbi:hypothetical protein E7T06_07420 [Deinococcus sp. Arct2-2]|uniref:hypothetical protein n=1 Tax=Deinococcus sp. Arct2-2 TaxID=2568653 RepID=UPI0010A42294|nr:hypothetical protein [Deinococcus sp. Arct2-2]THF70525.1 hypothetical protein E7T06_07420 [Deinococcus sp. Arct2-2]